jgi:hypothetical protein
MRVGVTLGGGTCLIHRTQANSSTEEHGIFFTRQFLSDSEAKLLLHAETSNLDITLVMARRLTKKTELDDLIRRSFKHALESILNCEVHVWVWTMRHRWNGENNTEESFLVAAVSAEEGGRSIGKTLPGFENNASFCKLSIGSLDLECFSDIRHAVNKGWMDGFNTTQTVEIGKVKPGLSMGDILQELEGYSSHDILGIAKCNHRSNDDKWDKWLLLISSENTTHDWEKDPRPSNWTSLGWSHTIKRSPSPIKNSPDVKKYTTLIWDADGHTISKSIFTPNPNRAPSLDIPLSHSSSSQDKPNERQKVFPKDNNKKLPGGKSGQANTAKKTHNPRLIPPTAPQHNFSQPHTRNSFQPRTSSQVITNPIANVNLFSPLSDVLSPSDDLNPIIKPSQAISPPLFPSNTPSLSSPSPHPDPHPPYPPPTPTSASSPSSGGKSYAERIEELKLDMGLSSTSSDEAHEAVRTAIYAIVRPLDSINAALITSMIGEFKLDEIMGFLLDPPSIRGTVNECLQIIEEGRRNAKKTSKTLLGPPLKSSSQPQTNESTKAMGDHDDVW